MVSTRQQSNVGNSGESSGSEAGGIKTRLSAQQSQAVIPSTSSTNAVAPVYVSNKHFLDLPPEIFEKIYSYTGYKTAAQSRLVCKQMDRICGSILNSTFQKLQTQMLHRFHSIKAKMPRRESARRNHPLACESDIIETLHMRLTLLQMSFGKHIERKHCCFFAGEILDEVYRILHYIKVTPKLARPYRVTDELFDLSTMAMEYFKEYIEPTLPEIAYFGTDFLDFSGNFSQSTPGSKTWILDSPPHSSSKEYESSGPSEERGGGGVREQSSPLPVQPANIVLRKRIRKIKQGMKKYNSQLTLMKRELRTCKAKIADQQKLCHEYTARMDDFDKKNEETSRKFSTLLQELNKCKTELQYWRSKSPLSSLCVACGKGATGLSPEDLQFLASQGISGSMDEVIVGEGWSSPAETGAGAVVAALLSLSPPPPVPSVASSSSLQQVVPALPVASSSASSPGGSSATSSGSSSSSHPQHHHPSISSGHKRKHEDTPVLPSTSAPSKRPKKSRSLLKVRSKRS